MTIDELNALTTLTAADEVPVWDSEESGEPTKKITAQHLAAAIKTLASLLGTGDVVNDLISTATDKPGSANMLKTLNDKITMQQIVPVFGTITKGVCLCTKDASGNVALYVDFVTVNNLQNSAAIVYAPEAFRPSANTNAVCVQTIDVANKTILHAYVNEGADVTAAGAVRQRITQTLPAGLHVTLVFQYNV
jgi:hypothetical protein